MFALPAILDQYALFLGNPNYCPLDGTDLYEIIYNIIPIEDTTNYCPQDTVLSYEFYTITAPTIVSNNSILWFDASDASSITLNGNNVTQWNDKSTLNNHATQTTVSLQPTYTEKFNYRNAVTFNGDYMNLTNNVTSVDVRTLFMVSSRELTTHRVISIGTNGNFPWGISTWSSNNLFYIADNNNYQLAIVPDKLNFQCCDVFNNDTGIMYVDGTLISSSSVNTSTSTPYFNRIGARNTFSSVGKILEIIYFDTVLSTADRQLIEGYLAYKWLLIDSLPSGHPYKSTLPPNCTLTPIISDLYEII